MADQETEIPENLPTLLSELALSGLYYLAMAAPRPGAFAEVGVYKGGSAQHLYDIARVDDRKLWLFDTFRGIPNQIEGVDKHAVGDFGDVSKDDVARMVKRMPFDTTIVGGIFPGSAERVPAICEERFAFVHADADQFASTTAICAFFGPRMVPGGLILFDDYPWLDGCRHAVDEAFPGRTIIPACGRALVKF